MPLTYKSTGGGGDYKSLSAGSHIAVCNMVVDLGIQPGSGMYPEPKRQVLIRFEAPNERIEYTDRDGKKQEGPVVISKTFTASMHEKANLRKQLESWRGKKFTDEEAENFDVSSILGATCMLSVVETVKGDKVYANITSIGALPKGFPKQTAENKLVFFSESDEASNSIEDLPEWIQNKIKGQIRSSKPQPDYSDNAANYSPTTPDPLEITDEDIPF